jgi:DNA-binding NarL/FixJ family response regulator
MNCDTCKNYATCRELCEIAEQYASQDYISSREMPISLVNVPATKILEMISNVPMTRKEQQIVTLFGYGLNRQDVSQTLNISRNSLRVHICRMKKKM